MVSRSTPMVSSTVATTKPVRSLPAKQCVSTGRRSQQRDDLVQRALRSVARGELAVLVDHVANSGLVHRLVGVAAFAGEKPLKCLFVWGLTSLSDSSEPSEPPSSPRSGKGSKCTSTPSGTIPGPRRATSESRAGQQRHGFLTGAVFPGRRRPGGSARQTGTAAPGGPPGCCQRRRESSTRRQFSESLSHVR